MVSLSSLGYARWQSRQDVNPRKMPGRISRLVVENASEVPIAMNRATLARVSALEDNSFTKFGDQLTVRRCGKKLPNLNSNANEFY